MSRLRELPPRSAAVILRGFFEIWPDAAFERIVLFAPPDEPAPEVERCVKICPRCDQQFDYRRRAGGGPIYCVGCLKVNQHGRNSR